MQNKDKYSKQFIRNSIWIQKDNSFFYSVANIWPQILMRGFIANFARSLVHFTSSHCKNEGGMITNTIHTFNNLENIFMLSL